MFSVGGAYVNQVKNALDLQKIEYSTVANLGNMIEIEQAQQSSKDHSFFSKYRTLDEIYGHLDQLVKDFPAISEKITVGKSYKKREIEGIKIGGNSTSLASAPQKVVFHGGIHAREWIGPATVTYIATQLLKGYNTDANITAILKKYEFHIIPVLNVDGYIFSHEKDRMWRKNRQPNV